MSMIFQFRALSDENDHFARDYQLPYDTTLRDFHDYICSDLGYEQQTMSSFFLSDAQWETLQEFTLLDVGDHDDEYAPIPMESVTLSSLMADVGDRLIYTFDPFGNRSLFIEMTGVYKAEDGVSYPCTILKKGSAPDQFEPGLSFDEDSIFDEAMAEFGDFDGDDNYSDDF